MQYLKLPGDKLTDLPENQAEISGDLLNMLRELDTRLKAGIHQTLEIVGLLREKMAADYPEVAVRELLLNAIIHRDYQSNTPVKFYWFTDRIEIYSPGGLYGEVTPETLDTRSSYRNPVLAEAMKALGYVNRYGYGIQRAKVAMEQNGNPQFGSRLMIERSSPLFPGGNHENNRLFSTTKEALENLLSLPSVVDVCRSGRSCTNRRSGSSGQSECHVSG